MVDCLLLGRGDQERELIEVHEPLLASGGDEADATGLLDGALRAMLVLLGEHGNIALAVLHGVNSEPVKDITAFAQTDGEHALLAVLVHDVGAGLVAGRVALAQALHGLVIGHDFLATEALGRQGKGSEALGATLLVTLSDGGTADLGFSATVILGLTIIVAAHCICVFCFVKPALCRKVEQFFDMLRSPVCKLTSST